VGTALRPVLSHHKVISLTHRTKIDSESVTGDVTQSSLGLDESTYRTLASKIDVVVHCAAVTEFDAGADAARELNVAGTKRIAEFTAEANANLIYVGTAFIARNKLTRGAQGLVSEESAARPEDYLSSKLEAEAMLRDSGVPVTIARPSVVIGDSVTGQMSRFQGAHLVATGILREKFPFLPFPGNDLVDIIPQDLLAESIRRLVDAETPIGEYWLTSGLNALTADRFVELCLDVAAELSLNLIRPRMVTPDLVDRLIRPLMTEILPPQSIKQLDDLLALGSLFAGAEPFPSSIESLPGEPMTLPSAEWFESAFRASVRYLAHARKIASKDTQVAV
jgi:nucleoside-diphosphate-sugar epimerase